MTVTTSSITESIAKVPDQVSQNKQNGFFLLLGQLD